jgi:ferritin-like protein
VKPLPRPVSRRRVLQAALLSSLAACSTHRTHRAAPPPTSTSLGTTSTTSLVEIPVRDPATRVDILLLQTSGSLEHYASGIYTQVAGLDVAGRTGLIPLLTAFATHHADHAAALETATLQAGGRTVTQPNAMLSEAAMRLLPGLTSAVDVLEFLYGVELLSASTHRQNVGLFSDPGHNGFVMGIGGVEARHMTVLGSRIAALDEAQRGAWPPWPASGLPPPPAGLQPGVGL